MYDMADPGSPAVYEIFDSINIDLTSTESDEAEPEIPASSDENEHAGLPELTPSDESEIEGPPGISVAPRRKEQKPAKTEQE